MHNLVVTGGATGIGRATALRWATMGGSVGIVDIDGELAKEVAEQARAGGAPAAIAVNADVGDEEALKAAIDEVAGAINGISHALANAAIDAGGVTHELSMTVWQRVVRTNLTGVFITCKYVLQHMIQNESKGSIVCVSSPLACTAVVGQGSAAYSATKGGILGFVKSVAVEYASRGIRINALLPGATETKLMWARVADEDVARVRRTTEDAVPLGRLAVPEEIAAAATWLLSEGASYVTGSVLVCDGGALAASILPA